MSIQTEMVEMEQEDSQALERRRSIWLDMGFTLAFYLLSWLVGWLAGWMAICILQPLGLVYVGGQSTRGCTSNSHICDWHQGGQAMRAREMMVAFDLQSSCYPPWYCV